MKVMQMALVAVLVALTSSCSTINRSGSFYLQGFFTEVRYRKDGFVIDGPRKMYTFSQKDNRETLVVKDERLNQVILIDQGCDQKVDEIKVNKHSEYLRGDDETKELFKRADTIFQKYHYYLEIKATKEKWKKLSPLDIAGHNGVGNI